MDDAISPVFTKKELRESAKNFWRELEKNQTEQEKIYESVQKNFHFYMQELLSGDKNSGRIFASLPMKYEFPVLEWLANYRVDIYIPAVVSARKMNFHLYRSSDAQEFLPVAGFRSIYGGDVHAPSAVFRKGDIMLVPALGSGYKGHRLGRGGGYYDRMGEDLKNIFKVALLPSSFSCLAFQYEKHDLQFDKIITERGIVDIKLNVAGQADGRYR